MGVFAPHVADKRIGTGVDHAPDVAGASGFQHVQGAVYPDGNGGGGIGLGRAGHQGRHMHDVGDAVGRHHLLQRRAVQDVPGHHVHILNDVGDQGQVHPVVQQHGPLPPGHQEARGGRSVHTGSAGNQSLHVPHA